MFIKRYRMPKNPHKHWENSTIFVLSRFVTFYTVLIDKNTKLGQNLGQKWGQKRATEVTLHNL